MAKQPPPARGAHLGLVHADEALVDLGPGGDSADVPELVGVLGKGTRLHLQERHERGVRERGRPGSSCARRDSRSLPVNIPTKPCDPRTSPLAAPSPPWPHHTKPWQPSSPPPRENQAFSCHASPSAHLPFNDCIKKAPCKSCSSLPPQVKLGSTLFLFYPEPSQCSTAGLSKKMTHSPFRSTTSSRDKLPLPPLNAEGSAGWQRLRCPQPVPHLPLAQEVPGEAGAGGTRSNPALQTSSRAASS